MTDPTQQTTPTRDEAVRRLVPFELTDEMIESGRRYIDGKALNGEHNLPAQFRWHELWEAMLSSAPAPASGRVDAVAVKALEWIDDVAHSITGRYWLQQSDNLILLWRDQHRIKKFGNIELSKAAAQADYEQRIRSALSPAATPVSEAEPGPYREAAEKLRSSVMGALCLAVCDHTEAHRLADYVVRNLAWDTALAKPASSPAGGDVVETRDV